MSSTTPSPVVSIIVPAYNAGAHLESCLTGLLEQSFDSIEIVVVDDGSSDDTAAVASRMAQEHPAVIFLPLAENGGVARAREHAVAASRGEYVWFVDADDERSPHALGRLVAEARRTRADVVICGAEFVSGSGHRRPIAAPDIPVPISGRAAFRLLLQGEVTGHLWNKLFRRDLAARIQYTPARVHSDLAMVAQLLAGAARVTAIPDLLYSYVLRGGSIIHSGSRRAESLELVGAAVDAATRSLDPRILQSRDYRYFRLRFIVLSSLKDAVLGNYADAERSHLVSKFRSELGVRALLLLVMRGDVKRLILAGSARFSLPIYRRVLARTAAEVA